jgi:DNA-directed RNA polymerase subunit RPC12/RpoP
MEGKSMSATYCNCARCGRTYEVNSSDCKCPYCSGLKVFAEPNPNRESQQEYFNINEFVSIVK